MRAPYSCTESWVWCPHASDTRCTCKENGLSSHSSQPVDQPKLRSLLLLPWCSAIAGYYTSSDNSNNQQQLTAGYRQTSKSPPGTSQPRRMKTTYIHNNSSMWTLPPVLCMSSVVYSVAASLAFMIKELSCHASPEICRKQSTKILQLLSSIISANYFVIIYTVDNSQLMLATDNRY